MAKVIENPVNLITSSAIGLALGAVGYGFAAFLFCPTEVVTSRGVFCESCSVSCPLLMLWSPDILLTLVLPLVAACLLWSRAEREQLAHNRSLMLVYMAGGYVLTQLLLTPISGVLNIP